MLVLEVRIESRIAPEVVKNWLLSGAQSFGELTHKSGDSDFLGTCEGHFTSDGSIIVDKIHCKDEASKELLRGLVHRQAGASVRIEKK